MVYIESRAFTRRLYQLAGATALDVLSAVQADLIKNPVRGDLVPGLGGIRKARCSNPARRKGKRGGYRYLFLYLENRSHIHLLYLLLRTRGASASNVQEPFWSHPDCAGPAPSSCNVAGAQQRNER